MTRTLLGQAVVDSGTLMVVDPCYVKSDLPDDFLPLRDLAVEFRSYGDGSFDVYLEEEDGHSRIVVELR